jgi:HPt (histidine-containing phosphotransfer) domain-containing protein
MGYRSNMRMRTGPSNHGQPGTVPFLPLSSDTVYPVGSCAATRNADETSAGGVSGFPVLDADVFNDIREVFDAQTLAQAYRDLLSQTRQRIELLASDRSAATLSKIGHTLRGTASMFGAHELALLATELEYSFDSPGRHVDLLHRMEVACVRLEAALHGYKVSV